MINKEMNRRGQVTIFIIVAILIVAGILVYYLWLGPSSSVRNVERLSGFDGCVQDSLEGKMETIGERGGFVNPDFTYMYDGDDVTYLCYTNLYYKPCVVQSPLIVNKFEDSLELVSKEEIETCYDNSINDLKAKGYDVAKGDISYEIELGPGIIDVKIQAPTSVSGQNFVNFDSRIPSAMYDLLMIATSIVQYEIAYGDSDVASLMLFYPGVLIEKIKRSDGTTVYILTDKQTGAQFKFASRSYAWPAGYGMGSGLVGG